MLSVSAGPVPALADPTLSLDAPTSEFQNVYGYNINGNNTGHVVIDGTSSATGGTVTVTLTDSGSTQVSKTGVIGSDGSYSVALNASTLADGTITVDVHADDGSGNTGDAPEVTLKKDATPPVVDNFLLTPPDGHTTVQDGDAIHVTGTMNGTGSNPIGGGSETVLLYQYDADGNQIGGSADLTDAYENNAAYTLALNASAATIQATFRFRDQGGNVGTTESNVVNVGSSGGDSGGGTPAPMPNVTITGAPSGTTSDTSATFTVLSDVDGSTFACTLDVADVDCSSGSYTATGLADGSHTFSASATAAGQTGTASASFTVDTPPMATVAYSTTALTNGDVTATMTADKPVTITNNGGSDMHTFTDNGSFTFEFTDTLGSTGSVTATVSNIDKTVPAISTPADQTFEATGVQTTPALVPATATDDNGATITHTPTTFGLGTTEVTWTATDDAGNQSTATSQVTVTDTTAPAITGTSADVMTEATSADGASVSFAAPTASDLVDGTVAVSCDKTSGDTFPLGDTTVTCTAEDAAHNIASVHFTVTVQDTTAPVVAITAPADGSTTGQTPSFGFTVNDNTSSTKKCTIDGTNLDCSATQMSGLAAGLHTVIVTATDEGGNTASATSTFAVEIPASDPAPTNSGGGGGGGGGGGSVNTNSTPAPSSPAPDPTPVPVSTPAPAADPAPAGEVLGASTYNFTRTLQIGSTGDDVTQLQQTLTNEGVYTGPITGFFGNLTQAGVMAYQAKYGIEQVGVVGPITLAQLNGGTTPASANTGTAYTFTQYLAYGASGAEVTQLQNVLIALNLLPSPPTGWFGPLTEQAVVQYQAQHGIEQTGTVGPLTRAQLNQH